MTNDKISNERMDAILETISEQVRYLLFERADDMLRAWHENIEEASENEDKFPPLKLSIASTVDLEASKIESSVTFTTRYKSTLSGELPDPDQMEFQSVKAAVDEQAMAKRIGKVFKKSLKDGESVSVAIKGGKTTTEGIM